MAAELEIAFIGLAGALLGGGLTSLTTWLIARSERAKFARERIWDLRREGYTKILAKLAPASRLATHEHHSHQDDIHGHYATDEARGANAQINELLNSADAEFGDYRLALSLEFVTSYEQFREDLAEANHFNLIPPERAEGTAQVLKAACKRLTEIGTSEVANRP